MGASNSRENEVQTNHAIKIPLRTIYKVCKSICKISYMEHYGTGFFMLLNDIKCLFTNYHIISKDLINKVINIEIYNNYNYYKKSIDIILDKNILNFLKI
jgi:hypothetical protein